MASAASNVTVDDLPDHVLERVFVLAGPRYGPAIVGVCKRWARVHWGSPQLWRHVTVSAAQLEQPPIALRPDAPLRMFAEHEREHQRRREAGWQAAKRAQLQRVGHLAEAATFSGRVPPALLSALLHRLHPAALRDLELPPHLSEEQAFILAGFTQLTRLATNAGVELSSILPRLAKLQHLTLARGQVSTQLMNALQSLAALTCLELKATHVPTRDLLPLSRLRQLRHLALEFYQPTLHLPPLASCPSLESYSIDGRWQLAGFVLAALSFNPAQAVGDGHTAGADSGGQPGSLTIEGILLRALAGGDDEGDSDSEGEEEPPAEPAPQLNALLEATLPPGAMLQQLTLSYCSLDTSSLQRLPAIANLQCLELLECSGCGGMDAPMQALVQLAPALTGLRFEACNRISVSRQQASMLNSCPVYLLAHPSLRSLVVLNRHQSVEWDLDEALHRLPSLAATAPVLEHLTTDALPFMPPALAAVSSLRSLAFLDQPEFELTGDVCDLCLALPHLTSLTLPQLTEFEQQAAAQLRRARPGFALQVQPIEEHEEQQQQDQQMQDEPPHGGAMQDMCVIS